MKICLPLALLAIAAPGFTQTPPAKPVTLATTFVQLDANKDGQLSLEESKAKPALQTAFESLDRNADGYLAPEEFEKWPGAAPTTPSDPSTAPRGSGSAQHMPKVD
jgi:Ca2+-binding EF-hand superfamily protein